MAVCMWLICSNRKLYHNKRTENSSYMVHLFKQKVISQKVIFLLPWHHTTIFSVDSLIIFTVQTVHSHMYRIYSLVRRVPSSPGRWLILFRLVYKMKKSRCGSSLALWMHCAYRYDVVGKNEVSPACPSMNEALTHNRLKDLFDS